MKTEFKALKFRIANEDQSKRLQIVLFDLGYNWYNNSKRPIYTDEPYIITRENAEILWGNTNWGFDSAKNHQEQDTEEFIKMHTKDALKPHVHKDLIIAWADGVTIQVYYNGKWHDANKETFQFSREQEVRIKPEPVEVWQWAYQDSRSGKVLVTANFYSSEEDFKKSNVDIDVTWVTKIEPTKLLIEQ